MPVENSHNFGTILSTGSQLRLFYCSLNADLFKLWHTAIESTLTNIHPTNFNAAKNDVKNGLFWIRLDGLQHLDIYKHTLHEAQDQN